MVGNDLPIWSPLKLSKQREALGLSRQDAAKLIRVNYHTWQKWESGERFMPENLWELWLIKTGQLKFKNSELTPIL